ncbi:MAG: TolC family protein [Planctomycetota bacterium]|nr:MAG: TolC family protein [Planctomycetota bacterium]
MFEEHQPQSQPRETGRRPQARSLRAPRWASAAACAVVLALGTAARAERPQPTQVVPARLERLPPVAPAPEEIAPPELPTPAAELPQPEMEMAIEPYPVSGGPSVMVGPAMTQPASHPNLPPPPADPTEVPLPINLATALRLSDARPLIVAAAQARIQIAAAELERANVLWLPNVNGGNAYIFHAGGKQQSNGALLNQNTNFLYAGGSLELKVATTDAIFEPLAARQDLRARRANLQAAKNEALLETANAYFTVQQARGSYTAMLDVVQRSEVLVKRIEAIARGLAPRDEIYRSRTLLAQMQQDAAVSQQQWRVSSARLTRVLRLNPEAIVVPLEPEHLQVTLIEPQTTLDELIPVGLTYRPELAAHQAIVQATLARLKQERMRPLLPSILITGHSTPEFLFQGGIFATGSNGLDDWAGRADIGAQVVWRVDNLGFGNQALIRKRRGENNLAMVELFNIQDYVAAEVTQAKADVESAAVRMVEAERGLKTGLKSYAGNLQGLGQTHRFHDVLVLVNRPQEVVAALEQLKQAYLNYYATVADYNRAQFKLFYALGFPAKILACERTPGVPEPIDTSRPAYLPPVFDPATTAGP